MKETIGGCLIAVGILIAGATGLCMSILIGLGSGSQENFIDVVSFLGIPCLVGVGLIIGGVVLIRSGRHDLDPGDTIE